jgi:hypothetical protein
LQQQTSTLLPQNFPELGQLVAIDGSLIDAVLSWSEPTIIFQMVADAEE